jgi:hypothetical protein
VVPLGASSQRSRAAQKQTTCRAAYLHARFNPLISLPHCTNLPRGGGLPPSTAHQTLRKSRPPSSRFGLPHGNQRSPAAVGGGGGGDEPYAARGDPSRPGRPISNYQLPGSATAPTRRRHWGCALPRLPLGRSATPRPPSDAGMRAGPPLPSPPLPFRSFQPTPPLPFGLFNQPLPSLELRWLSAYRYFFCTPYCCPSPPLPSGPRPSGPAGPRQPGRPPQPRRVDPPGGQYAPLRRGQLLQHGRPAAQLLPVLEAGE